MLAPTKRRHVSYYLSLPLVIAIVFLLVAKLAALQRADMIAELADHVAHRDTPEATAAVRQLGAMPRPPVAILVSAATSTDRKVAEEARHSIGRLLRRSQRQIEAKRGLRSVSRQLAELAEALAARLHRFATSDYPWLDSTTREILWLSNRIPEEHTPLVATHCDAILAAIAPIDVSTAQLASNKADAAEPFVGEGSSAGDRSETQQARMQREFSTPAAQPVEASVKRADQFAPAAVATGDSNPTDEHVTIEVSTPSPPEELIKAPWRAGWSHPMLRMMPTMPINESPMKGALPLSDAVSPELVAPPDDTELRDRPLAEVDSRALLGDWLRAEGSDVFPMEQELTRRGFGRLSKRLVQELFSEVAEDRMRLVNDVLIEPGVDARPWLMLLADDADADVRLLAVTIMATSSDLALVEKAWQVSIRDRDPRIAGLAGRLRERRAEAQRR